MGRSPSRSVDALDRPKPLPAHVGAWLDRYLWEGSALKDDKPGRMALLESAVAALQTGTPATNSWKTGYERWKRHLAASGIHRHFALVKAKSRILLHVDSSASVTDGSILLHHTWGVPYLPGSALKGVVRSALTMGSVRQRFGPDVEVLGDLLGQGPSMEDDETTSRAAFIDFLDAPWVPTAASGSDWSPLALDVVTPHHGRYYTASEERPYPTDFDEPTPTHRLSLSPGTQFHIVIEADGAFPGEWLERIMDVLCKALEHDGIGAWTTSGYGRLERVAST